MSKRYFEFVEGTSSKFWEIWKEGVQVFTRYGRIGSSGQTTVKDEGTAEKAQKLYDKLIREKTGKGYQEKGTGAAAPSAPAPAAAKPAPRVAEKEDEDEDEEAPKPKPKPAAAPAAGSPGFRRFEFVEGGSSKFWEIKLEGTGHTVRYGKIGTVGQEKAKDFGSEAAAQKDYDKMVKEKTGKGYVEVDAAPAGPPPPELDPTELERHLREVPPLSDNPEPYLVFADWLQSKGHPWGKLISLQHGIATAPSAGKRAELEKEEKVLLREHGHAIVGGLARSKGTDFTWHYGFIRGATLGSPAEKPVLVENLKTLVALPAARMLESVTLDPLPKDLATHQDWGQSGENIVNPWQGLPAALELLPPTVKRVCLGSNPPGSASAYVALPDLRQVAGALPGHVEALEVTGSATGELGALSFPSLRSLEVRLAAAESGQLNALRDVKAPKLEKLHVWLGGEANCVLDDVYGYDYDSEDEDGGGYPERYPVSDLDEFEVYDVDSQVTDGALQSFLAGAFPATLKNLGLRSGMVSPSMCTGIATAPVVKQLEVLDLSNGTITDDGANALVAQKKQLAHLKKLVLDGNLLSKDGVKKVTAELPNASAESQRTGSEPDFFFRAVATME